MCGRGVSLDVNGEHAGVTGRLHVLDKALLAIFKPRLSSPHLTDYELLSALGTSTRYFCVPGTEYTKVWHHSASAPPCRSTFRHVRPASVLPFPSQSSEVPARNLLSPFLLSFRRAEWISDRLSTVYTAPESRTKMGKKWEK